MSATENLSRVQRRRPGENLRHDRQNGRAKGVPNKLNATIKEMILGALYDVGGQDYLAARALDQPVAFMALLGRVLPLQLTGNEGKPIAIDFQWAPASTQPTLTLTAEPEPVTIDADDNSA